MQRSDHSNTQDKPHVEEHMVTGTFSLEFRDTGGGGDLIMQLGLGKSHLLEKVLEDLESSPAEGHMVTDY